ncbi:DNA mismatch repair protein MutS [Synechococcus sp. H55.10]|uniref:DNA mismatch repair protein MutS n=1 Tax=Synechococcus sp. H55.10 TaxID=2964503 RepID=UPI0039C6761A
MTSSAAPEPTWDALQVDPALLTPMMQHYVELKRQYPHAILLYRLGDFYEMFFQDAQLVSRELELVLTGREAGAIGRVPMCGIPYHAFDRYAAQLVAKGYALAVCDQMEPADQAKGLVRREVTRVITPGTVIEEELLQARQNNYLAAIVRLRGSKQTAWGLAYADISTGEFWVCQSEGQEQLEQELARLQPAEILLPTEEGLGLGLMRPGDPQAPLGLPGQYAYTLRPAEPFELAVARDNLLQTYGLRSLEGLGCEGLPLAIRAAGGLLHYLEETQKNLVQPSPQGGHPLLRPPRTYQLTDYLILDAQTRRNLELTQTIREGAFVGSLLWVLDHSRTAMGGRTLRRWLLQPLRDREQIRLRQDTIQELLENPSLRTRLGSLLDSLYDLERLANRVASGTANPRELVALGSSLGKLPQLAELVAEAQTPLLQSLQQVDPALVDLGRRIEHTLLPSPPPILTEGGLIRPGVDAELDRLRQQVEQDRQWIAQLEKTERERTGIPTLKVGFNKAFGYYLSISRAKAQQVPKEYIRKQTLTNEERFITPELKEKEARILTAQTDINQREYELFVQLRQEAGSQAAAIRQVAQTLAAVDALFGLAEVAVQQGYTRPVITADRRLIIEEGRHPVVEKSLPQGLFVPNSVRLGSPHGPDLIVLTGPNMSGKSTYLRQIGLIQILAQMGSFVPAQRAELGLCDRVFTRIGAVDDLATGQSTFMVEMNETANILNHAGERSLVLLDEIGRGTATFDGLSIAWAVAEYLATQVRARTIFATHYHELNQLETLLPNVANFQVVVKELRDRIIFLHQVQPGGADRSYGIEVGRMAGLPQPVIERAQQVLALVEQHSRIGLGLRNQGKSRLSAKKKQAEQDSETDGIVAPAQGDQLSLLPASFFPKEL